MLFFLTCPKVYIIPNRMTDSLMETFLSWLVFSQFSVTGHTPKPQTPRRSYPVLSLHRLFRLFRVTSSDTIVSWKSGLIILRSLVPFILMAKEIWVDKKSKILCTWYWCIYIFYKPLWKSLFLFFSSGTYREWTFWLLVVCWRHVNSSDLWCVLLGQVSNCQCMIIQKKKSSLLCSGKLFGETVAWINLESTWCT